MTVFGYAKRDLHFAAYGGGVLQRFEFIKVCMGENGNRHWVIPEKIHTPPTDGILEILAEGGGKDPGNPGGRGG